MAQPRKLTNPPITEAVIDIRVRFDKSPRVTEFSRLGERIGSEYPTQETRNQVSVMFQIGADEQPAQHDASIEGYVFRSQHGLYVAQSKPEGFTFSRLKPYADWGPLLAEAWRLWLLYRETFCPTRVVRLSTRFINRIEIDTPNVDLDDYFILAPRLPENVPQNLSAFSTTVTVPGLGPETFGHIRAAFDARSSSASKTVILLDIDIIRECDFDPKDDSSIRTSLNELRPIKNSVFFGSLTDKALELFL